MGILIGAFIFFFLGYVILDEVIRGQNNINELFKSSGKEIVKKTVNICGRSITGFGDANIEGSYFLSFGSTHGDTIYKRTITYFEKIDDEYRPSYMEFNDMVSIKEIDDESKPRMEVIYTDISHIPRYKNEPPRYKKTMFYIPKGTIIK